MYGKYSMQITGPTEAGSSGFALGLDTAQIVQKVISAKEAKVLPTGTVVGDLHGGLTFTDAVAAVLENRSLSGWQEVRTVSGEVWTVIVLNR